MLSIRTLAAASALLLASTAAHAETWQIDPTHTRVGFRVSHMMVSSVEGSFPDVSGTLDLQPGKLSDAKVSVEVTMNTVSTGNDQRDEHLRTSDFLDVANHPTMTFSSTGLKAKRGGDRYAPWNLSYSWYTPCHGCLGPGTPRSWKSAIGNFK